MATKKRFLKDEITKQQKKLVKDYWYVYTTDKLAQIKQLYTELMREPYEAWQDTAKESFAKLEEIVFEKQMITKQNSDQQNLDATM